MDRYAIRIEDGNGVLERWTAEGVPYAAGDVVLHEGKELIITERVWDGPRTLILRVERCSE